LSVSGVKSAILISIIAALLSLIPYIGNIIGFVLAIAMATFTGAGSVAFIGVTITFTIAQFVESYILEPYVVGKKVDLNPLVTILVVVLGGAVWGVTGMIISIPVFGILKIVFDHISVFHPLGYMLGEEDISSLDSDNIFTKAADKIKD
jgi:predicted PurR-regulated permease PerM